MDQARTALSESASLAASCELRSLEKLVPRMQQYGDALMSDHAARQSAVEIVRALGYDEFEIDMNNNAEERKRRIEVCVIEVLRERHAQSLAGIPIDALAAAVSAKLRRRVSKQDIYAAAQSLAVLGGVIQIISLGNGADAVRSDCAELSSEQGDVLRLCDTLGYVTTEMLVSELQWTSVQASSVIDAMVRGGMLWVDAGAGTLRYFVSSAIY